MKTNIDEPCAGNLQARFFRGSCSNKTQTRGVKLQLLPNSTYLESTELNNMQPRRSC
ncbi:MULTISPECIES: hypothetical protein [unclassified Wolbachia]|uniref:hypothetical protein n=1 Tax=unclassified Wolbachia TaxID=2640676 RepID=UPI0022324F6D|nr:hypothetical protein [Wolbachia endosymbiont (group A) of Hylaeus communis]